MKKVLTVLAASLLLFCLCGCQQEPEIVSPAEFFYPRMEFTLGDADSVIASEIRETSGISPEEQIKLYLAGPENTALTNPFPRETGLVSVSKENATLKVVLTDGFASLDGVDMTIACECLGRTCLQLHDVERVEISAENALLNEGASVIVDGSTALVDEGASPVRDESSE